MPSRRNMPRPGLTSNIHAGTQHPAIETLAGSVTAAEANWFWKGGPDITRAVELIHANVMHVIDQHAAASIGDVLDVCPM